MGKRNSSMTFNDKGDAMKMLLAVIVLTLLAAPPPLAFCAEGDEQEPTGAALYKKFTAALDEMRSLSLESRYLWTSEGKTIGDATIRYFLKKPDLYRVEIVDRHGKLAGILVCDSKFCWKRWPLGTIFFSQYRGEFENEVKIYTMDRAVRGMSISHQFSVLPEVCMPVFNANAFFRRRRIGHGVSRRDRVDRRGGDRR